MTTEFRLTPSQQASVLPLMQEPGRAVLGSCHYVDATTLGHGELPPALFVRLGTVPAGALPKLRAAVAAFAHKGAATPSEA